jgi:hypothetical protein
MILTWLGRGALIIGVVAAFSIGLWVYIVNNVEQPRYTSILRDGPLEIRDYPPLVVAEVITRGDRKSSVNAGFRPLAGYIFAKERGGESISMTAPVTQTPTDANANANTSDTWRVRFIMPSKYTLETLPKPAGANVSLQTLPAMRRAAVQFSGVATDDLIATKEADLRAWLASKKMASVGAPHYAYYNDPFTPGPLRRNEVMLDLNATEN